MNHNVATENAGGDGISPAFWRRDWFCGALLLAITFLAYAPVWHAGFVWDDDVFLTGNPLMKVSDGLHRFWFTASTPDYFPMTSSLLWMEWRLWGADPLGYHLVNVLLHAVDAVVLWQVLLRLKIPAAWFAAAIFALHPVSVESVAWITEGKNTLCLFFFLTALWCWVGYENDGGAWRYGLALALFVLALLSKTAVAPMPVVLLVMAWFRRGRVERTDWWRTAPFFAVAAVLGLVTVWFQSHRAMGHGVVRADGFGSRVATAGAACWFYACKAVLPLNLCLIYPRWKLDGGRVFSYLPLALLAGLFFACWHFRSRWGRGPFFCLAYFVLMLLPVLGIWDIYYMRFSLVADWWQYFAIAGPIVLTVALIRKPLVLVAVLLFFGASTWKRCAAYADAATFWQTAVRQNPDSALVQDALGTMALRKGDAGAAISRYQKAVALAPDYEQAHSDLGIALLQNGQAANAVEEFQKALGINPDLVQARNNLGFVLLQNGQVDEAVKNFQKCLETDPRDPDVHYNLGNALLARGQTGEAVTQLEKSLELKPGNADVENSLGNAFMKEGQMGPAITHFQNALRLMPDDPKFQNNLAWLLATCSDKNLRDGRRAVELALSANARMTGVNLVILHTLGAAFAEAGRFPDAIQTAEKAISVGKASRRDDLLPELNRELERYKAGLPLHP